MVVVIPVIEEGPEVIFAEPPGRKVDVINGVDACPFLFTWSAICITLFLGNIK
jgi:hypothetical protein